MQKRVCRLGGRATCKLSGFRRALLCLTLGVVSVEGPPARGSRDIDVQKNAAG